MKQKHRRGIGWITFGLALGTGGATLQGCTDDGPGGRIAEQCGLDVDCTAGGFAEGQASISGIASIDAFFGAAIDLNAAIEGLSGSLRANLDAIGASVGLEPGASGAELAAGLTVFLDANLEGGLTIDYQPAQCSASVEAGVSAAAECDVDVDPGEVSASCSGSCDAEAGVEVDCGAEATLMCSGTAPQLDCSAGTCSGACVAQLEVAAECSGTCRGSCTVDGSTMTGFDGACAGECDGECAVDMSAGGECEFSCEGNCDYEAPEGGCDASATASCQAEAGASIECSAGCEGTVDPPSVSAECEATVDAKASASVQCTPPTLSFSYELRGDLEGGLQAEAEFRAWLEGFRIHFGAILAARAEAEVVVDAAAALVASASGAVQGAVEDLSADANISAAFGARCALIELPIAAEAMASSQGDLTANLSAAVEVVGVF